MIKDRRNQYERKYEIRPPPQQKVRYEEKLKHIHSANHRDLGNAIDAFLNATQNPRSHQDFSGANQLRKEKGMVVS